MNLASACVASPGWKAAQPRGERGSAFDYGFHVKAEVTEGLTEAEQLTVLKTAADRAREEALRQTRNKVREGDPSLERTRLRLWCDNAVTAHVEAFMKEHDEHHRVFHEQVTQAKQANGI